MRASVLRLLPIVAALVVLGFLVNGALADPPPTFVVTTNSDTDDGSCTVNVCSLRDAVAAADAAGGGTIHFAILSGVRTITLDSDIGPLPDITAPVTIDGTSQPGTTGSPFGIAIKGSQQTGLVLAGGSGGSTIRGLALGNFTGPTGTSAAIEIDSNGNTIAGNSIGVAADGVTAATNRNGIFVSGKFNTIGGNTAADRNVVVNSSAGGGAGGDGILIQGNGDNVLPTKTVVSGNYVGVLGDGATVAGNEDSDIHVIGSADTMIGGPTRADGNVLAGSGTPDAIFLGSFADTNGSNTTIRHNLIGLTADGSESLYGFSVSGNGIDVDDHGSNTIADNTIASMYQGIDICDSPDNTVVRNLVGSSTANPGGPDLGVGSEGISMENGFCDEIGFATGNLIGGAPGDGNVVTHSSLHNVAVDADNNEVSYNTVRGTAGTLGGPDVQVAGNDNLIEHNTITGALSADTLPGDGVGVDSGNGNTISQNSIHSNQSHGIRLGSGANDDQTAPSLTSASLSGGNLTVTGNLGSAPDGTYDVEIFQSLSCEFGGAGTRYVGTFLVDVTGGSGEFGGSFPAVSSGTAITATATAPDGSTSAFSACSTASGSATATYVVNTSADSDDGGQCTDDLCSLRDAIKAADSAGGATIEFDIPGAALGPTIALDSTLPAITAPVKIDGTTQPGTPAGTPGVTLDGRNSTFAGFDFIGLDLGAGSANSVVRGLAFGGFDCACDARAILSESDNNTIAGNWFGIGADSSPLNPNQTDIEVTGNDNTIGGDSSAGDGNVLSSSFGAAAIRIVSADGNVIQGNTIGYQPNGSVVGVGVDGGIDLQGATHTVIGNDAATDQLPAVQSHPELGNVILSSTVGVPAILLEDDPSFLVGSSNSIVAGNFIGVDRHGNPTTTTPGPGVDVEDSGPNQIGPGNIIAHLTSNGVRVYNDGDGPYGNGNRIAANSIFDTGGGIDLISSGNAGQPAPVLDGYDTTTGTLSGTVAGGGPVYLEVFTNPSCGGQFANGAGQNYITYEASATGTFDVSVPEIPPGMGVTVTSTDQSSGDTSEFSNCVVAAAANTFTVTTSADSNDGSCTASVCSLRDAINAANAAGGGTIEFHIGAGGQHTIGVVTGPLPAIGASVTIDGTSQPGYAGTPLIVLDGGECDCSDGISVTDGSGAVIEGLSITGFSGYGIDISGGDSAAVQQNVISGNLTGGIDVFDTIGASITGNKIGTDATGSVAVPNGDGIDIGSADGTVVGGAGLGEGNLISGNDDEGIFVSGLLDGFTAQDNVIGLNAAGTAALGNGDAGIDLQPSDAQNNVIDGNVISGNFNGITLNQDGVETTSITGNLVGTDPTGTTALGNTNDGIFLNDLDEFGISVGGTDAASRNVVSGNGGYGIHISGGSTGVAVEGNYVGTSSSGTSALPNAAGGIGIEGSAGNTIGGSAPGAGNLVSGNTGDGIALLALIDSSSSSQNTVAGNYVGVNASGETALPNTGYGVLVTGDNNTIGGPDPGDGNLVSGNELDGVSIQQESGTDNVVSGNLIGTDADGLTAIGNSLRGVYIAQDASSNTIGGRNDAERNVISGNGTESSGGGVALGSAPGGGNVVLGNYIGTDSTGGAALPNAHFGVAIDGSDETIGDTDGGGNTIAFNGGPGVLVSSGSGDAIRQNSIHDNDGLGIELGSGANDGVSAPSLSQASRSESTLSLNGTLQGAPGDYVIDVFQSPTCDPSGSGEGQTFVGEYEVSIANSSVSLSQSLVTDSTDPVVTVTATASGGSGSTSEFSNCASTAGGGVLSGSMGQSIVKPVDLTGTGTADWALWGYNSTAAGQPASALTPNETKASGGRQISNLSIVNGDGTATRGFGSFTGGLVPFNFNWTDGAPDAAVSGGYGGLTAPKLGQGLSFTVPAGTAQRTLTIWTSAHYADGTLTAQLSDGSAPPFSQTVHAVQGDFQQSGENAPAIFTLDYHAASAGQHLTVAFTQSANNSCGGCEDVVVYAAALSGGHATGASATFSSGASVQMPGTVPISGIPLSAFDPQPSGAPPISTHGTQLNQTQLNQTQLNQTQLNQTQLNQTQLNQTQLNQTQLNQTQLNQTQLNQTSPLATQLNQTQLNQTQLNQTQLNQTQLNQTQLNQTQLNQSQLNQTQLNQTPLDPTQFPDGWAGLLKYTNLANAPLQTLTLNDVMSLTTADVVGPLPSGTTAESIISTIRHLTFANLEIQSTSLAQLSLGALLLGDFDINQLGSGLTSPIESQLNDWCLSFAPTNDPNHFCSGHATVNPGPDVGGPGIGYFNLIQLSLMGAPVQSLQLNQTQLNQTQLNQTQLNQTQLNQTPVGHLAGSASGIVGMQLSRLDLTAGLGMADRAVSLLGAGVPNTLFDCSKFSCSGGTLADAQRANAILPTTTVGDLDRGNFFIGVAVAPGVTAVPPVTVSQLLDNVLGPNSAYKDQADFGDLVGLYLRASEVQWESLTPNILAIFAANRSQLSMSAGFTIQGSGTVSADVKIDLPAGFDYVPGSATLNEAPLGDPTITGTTAAGYTLEWQLGSVSTDSAYTLAYGAFAGTTVGPTQAKETVSSGGFSDSSITPFSVTDSFPGNGTTQGADQVDPTAGQGSVEMSTLPTAGAVDYYTIPMPAAGTRIQVHLTHLPADYDLALYSPRTTSVRTGVTPAPPLQDGIVSDTPVDLNGGSSGQLTPTGLADLPNPGIPLVQRSDNRHLDPEDVGMVSPGGPGVVTIAVYGYNGAFSPQAYTLRVKETAPPTTPTCSARTFTHVGTTSDALPSLSSLPSNLNTIILVDEKRLGDTYGATDEATAVGKLQSLANDTTLGVKGVIVPVETIPNVPHLYDLWDANPCDPDAANAVANAIADEVNAIAAARPSVKYVVFGGGDDQIPFFRLPDLSLIANESGFATQFGNNEYRGSLAAGDLLSDDPYLDTQPVPASGQQLFPPNLAGGRLVETAQEIAGAVTAFESAPTPGTLRSSTGFVSGYDFVADGAAQVATNLRNRGVNVTSFGGPTSLFSLTQLLAAAFPTGGPANINSWNGHYDNYRAQMANGDIVSTSGIPAGLNKGVFFTMGCHAGFQTTDAVVGSTVLDWPQYFAQHNTGFVGNTGYGLGDTDTVAFSEELMADLAGKLGGSNTLGQALLQAKQQYYLSRVAFSNYDQKALSEAELYGLPMYGVGSAPAPVHTAQLASPDPTPVTGTTASTSPSQGSLSSFPGNSVQSADFSATPHFSALQQGANGDYFTNDGQVQAPNYRPLQPYVSLPAARSGLVAHGVVIDGLTSEDHPNFTPDNVRPILNSSSTEPPPSFTDQAWPEKIPTLVSLGSNQNLNLITGQFFTDSSNGSGVERLWKQIDGRVIYSSSSDFTPPTIDSIDAFQSDPGQSDNVVGFTGRFSDLGGNVVFAQVIYDDGTSHWHAAQLQHNPSGLWSAGIPFPGNNRIQYFVEVCDSDGNCGYSSNKGNYFDALPLPSGTGSGGSSGTLTISPSRNADTGSWYKGSLTVSALTTAPDATVSVTVDGQPASSTTGIMLSGDGAHVVVARDSAGNTASAAYLIDTISPLITHTVLPASPDGTNGWYKTAPTVTFNCSDNLSGVNTCLVDGGGSNQRTLGNSSTSQTVAGTATDNAANTSHDSATVARVDTTAPATPTFNGIQAISYKPSALPLPGAISCSSSDSLSGLAGCAVTGYSSALGQHTLTATATDNAGNTRTAQLTYTVAKLDPVITWNPPASMLFGTRLSSTQLNASANVAGTFAYDPVAGTLLQPGSRTLSVTFTPSNTTDYNTATATRTITVGFSQACLTGTLSGSLTIKSGTAYCIQGGKVTGSVTVLSGASLYVSGGTLSGALTSTGATAVTLCGSNVGGSMGISSSTGLVLLGGATGSGCAANKFSGSVTLSGNIAGVTVVGNTIGGSVSASSNKGGLLFSGNKDSAAVTVSGNSGGVTFTNNVVSGSVTISNNTGGFTFSGNTISGTVTLKNNT